MPPLFSPQGEDNPTLELLQRYDATHLFLDRLRSNMPQLRIDNEKAPAIAQICRELDGLPLAIELAAARARTLPIEQIAQQLSDRFCLLTEGSRTALPKQKTLQAAIDWSWDLLTLPEQALLRDVSVFRGGFTTEALKKIATSESENEPDSVINRMLELLVNKSLVVREHSSDRYRLLETVREYAWQKLRESQQTETIHDRHLAYFLEFAEKAELQLSSSEQKYWMDHLENDHDNLRAALGWGAKKAVALELALRLAGALGQFWLLRGHWSEGLAQLTHLLALPEAQARTLVRAKALNTAGRLADARDDWQRARDFHQEALTIRKEAGDKRGMAISLTNLASLAYKQTDYATLRVLQEQSLAIWRELGNERGVAGALNNLGLVATDQGDYARARNYYEESLAISREFGDKWLIAATLNNLAIIARNQKDLGAACRFAEESLEIRREIGDKNGIADTLCTLGVTLQQAGNYQKARALYEESLAIHREMGGKSGTGLVLYYLALLNFEEKSYTQASSLLRESLRFYYEVRAVRYLSTLIQALVKSVAQEGDPQRAACLQGIYEKMRETVGATRPAESHSENEHNEYVEALRLSLSPERFEQFLDRGRAMTLEEAIAFALSA